MPQTRQTRGRPPAKGRNKQGRTSSRQRGRQSGRSGRGGSVVVKLPHVGARTAMRTSRRIPHRRPALEEPEMESDTEAAEEGEENDSLPPVAAYEEHQAEMDSPTEEDIRDELEIQEMSGMVSAADVGSGRRSRSLAARKDYINRRFLYAEEEADAEISGRHRGRHSRESPHRSHQRRGRRPRRQPRPEEIEEMKLHDDVLEEDIQVEEVVDAEEMEQFNSLRIDMDGRRRRGRRRRSENIDDDLQGVGGHLNKRSRRSSSGRRRDESDLLEVEDVGMTFPTSDSMDPSRRRRRGRGRPPKTRLHDELDHDIVSHTMLEGVSPPTGPVPGHPSPGMGDYEDEDDDDDEEMKAAEAVGAYDTADYADEDGLLSHSDESPVLVGRHGVRGGRAGYEMEDDDDFDDIEEASALVYGRPPRSAPGMSPGGRAPGHHHPPHGHGLTSPHGGLGKKYGRRHKVGPRGRTVPMGVSGSGPNQLLESESGAGPQGHHQMVMHGSHHHGHHGHSHGPVPGSAVVPPGSGRESVKSEDDMDDEFMFEEGAAFTADNDPPVGGEGTAPGLSHAAHHGPMTGIPGPWSAGRRKTPLKPLTAGGPRTSDLDIFMGLEEEGIMPLGAPRGEHSYSAMAQKGGSGHAGGLQDLDYYPPAAPQQYVEPPPDSHVPPPINKPTQHRHGRNSSRRPSILPRRSALPRNRQPSLCVDPPSLGPSTENVPATNERESSAGQIELPSTVVTTENETNAPVTSAETSDGDITTVVTSSSVSSATAPVTSSVSETEPSPAIAKSASAKLFQQRTKRIAEKEAAALSTTGAGISVDAIPPEGAVLVAGIPAFRVAPGGLSILRRIPASGAGAATQVAVTTAGTGAQTMKSVLGAANQQQTVVPTTGAQLSTGAATPAGDAWLKSKNMRIVVFRNEKGEQKTVVMPEEHGMRRIVSTPQGPLVTPGALGQPLLVQPSQQSLSQQQYVTIQQPQSQLSVLQPQPQQQNQPIRYVKIINAETNPMASRE